MIVIEVNNGFCRKPFESAYVPRSTFASLFVDVTNLSPRPTEYWVYDYETRLFNPPDRNYADINSAFFIASKWNDIRNARNTELSFCDWTVLPDSPLSYSEKRKWKAYRQALRDITRTYKGVNPVYVALPPRPSDIARPPFSYTFMRALKCLYTLVQRPRGAQ